jgi:hypothetical protein
MNSVDRVFCYLGKSLPFFRDSVDPNARADRRTTYYVAPTGISRGRMEHARRPSPISSSQSLPLLPISEEEMSPSATTIAREPEALEPSEWAHLVNSLPLFPPPDVPPPVLYPLLSPLLQQKLGLLSLGRGRNWPAVLCWLSPELSLKVHNRLESATWRPDGVKQQFRGYRRFDNELV